jgi:predicted amidophosphoribosyltransferase
MGHAQFDTVRYKSDTSARELIVKAVVDFLVVWKPPVEALVPTPPSNKLRRIQTISELAKGISRQTGLLLCDSCLTKTKSTGQMKDIVDIAKRTEILADAFAVDQRRIARRNLLLFDDLYDSGATASAMTRVLMNPGGAAAVYLLALTQTR